MNAWEVNFDGLVGLTHHYAGLSFGNEASTRHRFQVSNPRLAAKQGLLKMKALADAGFPQAGSHRTSARLFRFCVNWDLAAAMSRYWKRLPARHRTGFPASVPHLQCG